MVISPRHPPVQTPDEDGDSFVRSDAGPAIKRTADRKRIGKKRPVGKSPGTTRTKAVKPSVRPTPKRSLATEIPVSKDVGAEASLLDRVTRAIEAELSQIEIILGAKRTRPTQRTEAERRARTLASLARTLSEVKKLRAAEAGENGKPSDDDNGVPRDIDELRRALSRRLEQMVADAEAVPAAGDE